MKCFLVLAESLSGMAAMAITQYSIARVIAIPEFREKFLLSQGRDPIAPNTPEQFAREIEKDRVEGAELVKLTGARIE